MTHNQSSANLLGNCQVLISIPVGMISGVDIFANHLVRQLLARGVKAKIVSTALGKNYPTTLPLAADLPIDHLDQLRQTRRWRQRWQLMIDYLEAQSPCIYIPNYDYAYSSVSPKLSARVKVVGIAHSDDPVHYEHIRRLGHTWEAIVGVSQMITQQIAADQPALRPRLHTIPYGIELPTTRPQEAVIPDAPLKLIYCGRLEQEQKRVMDLIQIAQRLHEGQIPFVLTIVGDGTARAMMEAECRSYGLQACVHFTGKLPNPAVAQQLGQNTIFLLPSAYEGLPVSLLEAMAHGLVPVVSDLRSGIPEVIRHGENGLLAAVGDGARFAEHVTALYHHPAWRHQLAQAARRTIEQGGYSLDQMTEHYLTLFQTVLTQPFVRPTGKILPPPHLKQHLSVPALMSYHLQHMFRYALRQLPCGPQPKHSPIPEAQHLAPQRHTERKVDR